MREAMRGSPQLWLLVLGLAGACGTEAAPGSPTVVAGTGSQSVGAAGSGSGPLTPGAAGVGAPVVTGGVAAPPVVTAGVGAAGTGVPGVPGDSPGTGGGTMPCDTSKALATNCQNCHGTTPTFGAPMALMTLADFHAMSKGDPTQPVYKVALKRMNDTAAPMPPGAQIAATDKKALTDWLGAGASAATAANATCTPGEDGTTAPRVPHDAAYFKNGLTPLADETCYEFRTHGGQTAADTSPYMVAPSEHYQQFYFAVPWKADEAMTRFGAKYDNLAVLHHWLMFTSSMSAAKVGTSETTIGSTIGDTSQLIAGWAVGGDHVEYPKDTGLELIQTGIINLQWHFYNQGAAPAPDNSIVQICTTKKANRKNIGSLTFLGSENFNGPLGMPARTESKFGGTCVNDSGGPITIFGFTPHMHKLGVHMNTVIKRTNGMLETIFDKPFDFNSQISYVLDKPIVLNAGESILSTCTFNNTTNAAVPFGPSTEQEMCYNFTLSYPAKAMDNGAASLIGATNVCW